ncbi:MAG: hypothetical protein ACT6Q9_08240 [Polaromonas sp.]|uniref:hypothetical protein n=1 Tax=Polaromonas sp. TaxID=1869339 RepID=UPI0040373E4C
MFNKQAIYHKTPKGMESIANRQSGLGPRLRSLLIMIDGKRSVADLMALTGDGEALLAQLAQDGMIEPVGGAAAAAAPAAAPASTWPDSQAATTAPTPLVVVSLPEAKRCATRLLVELLGPTSEMLCMKIESASKLADFVGAVKRAREIVRDVKGAAAAERFIAEIETHTPQA